MLEQASCHVGLEDAESVRTRDGRSRLWLICESTGRLNGRGICGAVRFATIATAAGRSRRLSRTPWRHVRPKPSPGSVAWPRCASRAWRGGKSRLATLDPVQMHTFSSRTCCDGGGPITPRNPPRPAETRCAAVTPIARSTRNAVMAAARLFGIENLVTQAATRASLTKKTAQ